MLSRGDELSLFKQEINLIAYACENYEFKYSVAESSNVYAVLRKDQANKLVVKKDSDDHWVYFNVHDDRDSGSVIDLIQNRSHISLGEVRKRLRAWSGIAVTIPKETYPAVQKSNFVRGSIEASYKRSRPITQHEYLASRGLTFETLDDNRFKNMIRQDNNGNVLFPHFDDLGVTGYEIKNSEYSGFAKYGKRALWSSQCYQNDTHVVFVEGAIDALSYHQIRGTEHYRYHSVAGNIGGQQQPLIKNVLRKAQSKNRCVISAYDADENGERYHELLVELSLPGLVIIRDKPPSPHSDWNQLIDRRNY